MTHYLEWFLGILFGGGWLYIGVDMIASSITPCNGDNRHNRVWAFYWDHRPYPKFVGIIMLAAALAALAAFATC